MCWNKGRLCWKISKLFCFCHLKKLVRPETSGPYYVHLARLLLTACLLTNLINRSSGRLPMCFPLNCRRQKVRLTCYQAHHTVHSVKFCFGRWLHLFRVHYHGTMYTRFSELFIPSRVKDASSVNKMTLNLLATDFFVSNFSTPCI